MTDKYKEFFKRLESLCKDFGVSSIGPGEPDAGIYFTFYDDEYSIPIDCYEDGSIQGLVDYEEEK